MHICISSNRNHECLVQCHQQQPDITLFCQTNRNICQLQISYNVTLVCLSWNFSQSFWFSVAMCDWFKLLKAAVKRIWLCRENHSYLVMSSAWMVEFILTLRNCVWLQRSSHDGKSGQRGLSINMHRYEGVCTQRSSGSQWKVSTVWYLCFLTFRLGCFGNPMK